MIAIVDYQMGNLRSVQKAFERTGHEAEITADPLRIAAASKVVLPGVGAFADAIAEMRRRDLIKPVKDSIAAGKPFFGICLGLQMLFETGYEDGEHEGMGILKGEVRRFQLPPEYKVPHMGWNQLQFVRRPPVFEGVADNAHFYFVHSYYAAPTDSSVVAVQADYHQPFCAAVWQDNLFATQFHPEKSQQDGLRVLKNFAELP